MKLSTKISTAALFIFFMQLVSMLSTSVVVNMGGYDVLAGLLYSLAVLSLLLGIITDRRGTSWYKLGIITAVMMIAVVGAFFSRGREFLLLALYAMAMMGANEKAVLKSVLATDLFAVVIILFCGLNGIGGSIYVTSGTRRILSLGFLSPNMTGAVVFKLCSIFLCLNYEKHRRGIMCLILFSAAFTLRLFECRTAAVSLVVVFLLLISENFWIRRKIVRRLLPYLFIFLLALSVIIANYYNNRNSIWLGIDVLLSGRFSLWSRYYQNMKLTLLGDYFYTVEEGALDNAYLYIMYRYGLLALAIYFWINKEMTKSYLDSGYNMMLICAVGYEVMAFSEFGAMTVTSNIAMIVFFAQRFGRKKRKTGCVRL